ncbi:MAG: precorrin-6A synthase (deacetylating) [Pseudomonadota bacterium]
MDRLLLVGIGTGNPDHITLAGQRALREADVILVPEKGSGKEDLSALRHEIIARAESTARLVPFTYPVRDESVPYEERVELWHDEIARRWEAALAQAGGAQSTVALLVWGDPSLYDSTMRIAERLMPKPPITVVPGITSLQALTAAHAIPFNTLAGSVHVTTGRKLRSQGWPETAESVVVMLDGSCAFRTLDPDRFEIWWGAYLGMENEITAAGPLHAVSEKIVALRAEARAAHGWIMDTYLLRRLD